MKKEMIVKAGVDRLDGKRAQEAVRKEFDPQGDAVIGFAQLFGDDSMGYMEAANDMAPAGPAQARTVDHTAETAYHQSMLRTIPKPAPA